MSRGRGRLKMRKKAVRRWLSGRKSDGLENPTKEEIDIFRTGFNMGYKARVKKMREVFQGFIETPQSLDSQSKDNIFCLLFDK